jgi:hypothetical protein
LAGILPQGFNPPLFNFGLRLPIGTDAHSSLLLDAQ